MRNLWTSHKGSCCKKLIVYISVATMACTLHKHCCVSTCHSEHGWVSLALTVDVISGSEFINPHLNLSTLALKLSIDMRLGNMKGAIFMVLHCEFYVCLPAKTLFVPVYAVVSYSRLYSWTCFTTSQCISICHWDKWYYAVWMQQVDGRWSPPTFSVLPLEPQGHSNILHCGHST